MNASRSGRERYGWLADDRDPRDFVYDPPFDVTRNLPPAMDLRPAAPHVVEQVQGRSSSATAVASAVEFEQIRAGSYAPPLSRLFIYYNARAVAGERNEDCGARVRDCLKSVAWWGAPPEEDWPYRLSAMFDRPPERTYEIAARTVPPGSLRYAQVERRLTHLKACLAEGRPFIVGLVVHEGFESEWVARSGMLDLPEGLESEIGRFATLAVGYRDDKEGFIVRNSLGAAWGMQGHFLLPFKYVLDSALSGDMWCVTVVK